MLSWLFGDRRQCARRQCATNKICSIEAMSCLDIGRVGEEHGEPVDAHPPPSSWGQAILQRRAEGLVYHLSFIITSSLVLEEEKGSKEKEHTKLFWTKSKHSFTKILIAIISSILFTMQTSAKWFWVSFVWCVTQCKLPLTILDTGKYFASVGETITNYIKY